MTVPRPSPFHFYASAVIDKASRALAQPVLLGLSCQPVDYIYLQAIIVRKSAFLLFHISNSYRARADRGEVPHINLHYCACGRRLIEEKD